MDQNFYYSINTEGEIIPLGNMLREEAESQVEEGYKVVTREELSNIDESTDELDEMARIAVRYDLGEKPVEELPDRYKKNKYISGIFDYIKENGASTIEEIAAQLGVVRQQINSLFPVLADLGYLKNLGLEREPNYLQPKEPQKRGRKPGGKNKSTQDQIEFDDEDKKDFQDRMDRNMAGRTYVMPKAEKPASPETSNDEEELSFDDEAEPSNITSDKTIELQQKLDSISAEMKKLAKEYAKDKSEDVKAKLKDLTKQKKELENQLDSEELDEEIEDSSNLMMEGYERLQKLAGIKRII